MFYRYFVSLTLLFSIFTLSLPQIGYAQAAATQKAVDYSKQLTVIEEKLEKRRNELGIPGMSLVIVKDGQIIYMKGLGYKNFENKIAVTPDTQFAIGSATKAFTALSVLMSSDEGKVDLNASPKMYLPYFKMKDPETDKNMTVRDLMDHSSGLNRTDLALITGKLNRKEIIQVAGEAKPMAKLNEKWFYNNIMFAAAGEVTASVQKMPWEKFVPERIFKPLGMTNSNMSIKEMEKARDFSYGYEYNFDTKTTRRVPFRPIDDVAPAGSINSSARDMAKWIQFVINGGSIDGKRLVSEKNYEEWTKVQSNVAGKMNYGLGWFLREWNGMKVVEHGGNINGFNSLVAMIPEKKLGFVMLTNVTGSPLGNDLMPIVWENILGKPNAPKAPENVQLSQKTMERMIGTYNFKEAGFNVEVKIQDGNLVLIVPNQPVYTLKRVGERYFKLEGAPDGFFAKFNPAQGDATEIYLEQPQGNFTLQKLGGKSAEPSNSGAAKELIGKYFKPDGNGMIEVKDSEGTVTFNIDGQQPYSLVEKSKDEFSMSPLPSTYFLKVKRDDESKVKSVVVVQPEGEFEFKRADAKAANMPKISVDEVMAKAIEAAGGDANWRNITSRITVMDIDAVHQGVKGSARSYAKYPNKSATETTMVAVGKTIAKGWEFFDGREGGEVYSFASVEKYTGKRLEDARLNSDIHSLLNWKTNYKSVEIKGTEKVGDDECYVLEFTPEKGTKITEYYSSKSFLMLKRKGVVPSSTSEQTQPYTIVFSDYREVDGVKLPFKSVNTTAGMGDVVLNVKSVKHNTKIDDKLFVSKRLK